MANSPWVELGVLTHQLRNTQELCLVLTIIYALGKEAHFFSVPINIVMPSSIFFNLESELSFPAPASPSISPLWHGLIIIESLIGGQFPFAPAELASPVPSGACAFACGVLAVDLTSSGCQNIFPKCPALPAQLAYCFVI